MRLVCVLFPLSFTASAAQEMPVPVDLQFELFSKILTFDRSLQSRKEDGEIVIGVIYQEKFRPSLNAKEQFMKAVSKSRELEGYRFRCVPNAGLLTWMRYSA